MVALGPTSLPPTAIVLPRCWCGDTGAEIQAGEWLCEAGHVFPESEAQRIVREFASVGFPVLLTPAVVAAIKEADRDDL